MKKISKSSIPLWADPDLPDRCRTVPTQHGRLRLGRDDQTIRRLAVENLASLDAAKPEDADCIFVAVRENLTGQTSPQAVIRARGMRQAIDAFHEEHIRHWWLPNGEPDECQVGFAQLTPDTDFVILRKLRKEQLLGLGLS